MEEWRPIENHDGYEVSNEGRVRSLNYRRQKGVVEVLRPNICVGTGYPYLILDKRTCVNVHRLVAKAFIPNPDGKPEVDHIDRNRANNVVSNLRWATRCEQNLNMTTKRGATGERHIIGRRSGYSVRVKRNSKTTYVGHYSSLAAAVAARDEFLNRAPVLALVEDGHPEVVSD